MNCVKAETEIYKIQKLTYIADFQALINGFFRNILCTKINMQLMHKIDEYRHILNILTQLFVCKTISF